MIHRPYNVKFKIFCTKFNYLFITKKLSIPFQSSLTIRILMDISDQAVLAGCHISGTCNTNGRV